MKTVSIDFTNTVGKIKPMHCVNNGPFGNPWVGLGSHKPYAEAGFPYARNHDGSIFTAYGGSHVYDVLNIFPDFDADENDPANYDFAYTDKACLDIETAGTKVFYRLGTKIEHGIKKYQTIPPKDFAKWARICEHIIAHLCYGWGNGHHFNIQYWEIWNEADGVTNGSKATWQGTMAQFLDFYEVAAKHLKKVYPELKIGGPAYTGEPHSWGDIEAFIVCAKERNIPLDFFSWHGYSTDPHHYTRSVARVKGLLDKYGFTDTEMILNEWNYVRSWTNADDMVEGFKTIANEKGAAFDAASIITAQKSPLDMFMYFDCSPNHCWNGFFAPYTYELQKPYYAFWQFNKLYQLGKEVFTTSDSEDVYVCAASDGKSHAIQVVYYSDTELPEATIKIQFKGLTGNTEFLSLLVDKNHNNEPIRSDVYTVNSGSLYTTLKCNSSLLITCHPIDSTLDKIK